MSLVVDYGLTRQLLRDRSARQDERDDAAILLSHDDSLETISALLEVIFDETEPDWLVGRAAEALGYIWSRTQQIDMKAVQQMRPLAREELLGAFGAAPADHSS